MEGILYNQIITSPPVLKARVTLYDGAQSKVNNKQCHLKIERKTVVIQHIDLVPLHFFCCGSV